MTGASLEHLFDAFTQADTSTSRRFGGTGLGLAISRQLTELMGGTLSATSEMGVGSIFTARIPFRVGVAPKLGTDQYDLVGIHVLIVDDNVTNQRVLLDLVTMWGCTSAVANGAEQALALLRRTHAGLSGFDVVLLDLNMPGIDGYQLARTVRADSSLATIPLIMLTSSAQRGEAESSQQAGVSAYLTKPVRSDQLRKALRSTLGERDAGPSGRSARVVAADPGSATEPTASYGDSPAVLVVEDNLVNQKVFLAMLRNIGYPADLAANGFEALAALELREYAAVFMDCQMPEMDGYETTRRLRLREGGERHTHVIAVTAGAMAEDRARCLEAGMDDYLSKPIKAKELAAKLGQLLDGAVRAVVPTP